MNLHTKDKDESIERIMSEYGEEIKRFIYTYVKDTSLAEDLTQDVFFTVYLKLDTFEGKSSFKTWLYSIASNKCKDYLKSWHFRKVSYKESFKEFIEQYQKGPDDETMAAIDKEDLARKILKLPIKYREAILLFYYRDFSIQEISGILHISESTVKVRLHRGREKLKKQFQLLESGEMNG